MRPSMVQTQNVIVYEQEDEGYVSNAKSHLIQILGILTASINLNQKKEVHSACSARNESCVNSRRGTENIVLR